MGHIVFRVIIAVTSYEGHGVSYPWSEQFAQDHKKENNNAPHYKVSEMRKAVPCHDVVMVARDIFVLYVERPHSHVDNISFINQLSYNSIIPPITRRDASQMATSWMWQVGRECYHRLGLTQKTSSWWRHKMEPFSALLTLCAGNSPVTGAFPSQRTSNADFDVSMMWVRISG